MNNQTMLTQGKGGHCPTLGFGVPVAFLTDSLESAASLGEEFFP